MNIHLSVFVPLGFMDAQAYVGQVLTHQGFSSVNPYTKDVRAIIHTDDGLGAFIEVSVQEIEKRLHRGEVSSVQFWSGREDILVGWKARRNGWNFSISTVSWQRDGFDRIAKELFSDTLDRFHCDVDDKPTVELLFE